MGWDSYLNIGIVTQDFRKHIPIAPALLFSPDDYRENGGAEGDQIERQFVSTAGRCLDRLAAAGFSWAYLVRAYRTLRAWSSGAAWAEGLLFGMTRGLAFTKESQESAQGAPAPSAEANGQYVSPETKAEEDLSALIRYFRFRIASPPERDGARWIAISDLPGGAESDLDAGLFFNSFQDLLGWEEDERERIAIARAAGSYDDLRNSAPTLGWIFCVVTLLRAVEPEEEVCLDISEAYDELLDDFIAADGDVPTGYVRTSIRALASEAELLASLFSTLADFGAATGSAFLAGRARWLWNKIKNPAAVSANEKGRDLEDLLDALVRMSGPGLVVRERNFRTDSEELDLVLSNNLEGTFWASFASPLIFVECKNWSTKVGVSEARVFESKLRERGNLCRVGVFVAVNGVTAPFRQVLRGCQRDGVTVFVADAAALDEMVETRTPLANWLQENVTTATL